MRHFPVLTWIVVFSFSPIVFAKTSALKKDELSRSDNVNPPFTVKTGKKDKRRSMGDYEIIESKIGNYFSVRQKSSGEVMHSVNPPIEEANLLYIQQSNLEHVLLEQDTTPIVLWDVGLGAATNSMAAVSLHERIESNRELRIYSFENDLTPLKLALKNHGRFPHLFHKAPLELLKNGNWKSDNGNIEWKLIDGKFQEHYQSVEFPNYIFYDPFSFKTDSDLWTLNFFSELHSHLNKYNHQISLYTYSGATGVRGSMLGAGFFVAKGIRSGPKSDTTIAFTRMPISDQHKKILLDTHWLEKWKRSDAKYPSDISISKEDWEKRILNHPQFL